MFIISKFLLQFKFEHIVALTISNMPAACILSQNIFPSILPHTLLKDRIYLVPYMML
jgi:hypothetical protein